MTDTTENLYAQEYFEYLQRRGPIRKLIRKIYLRDIRQYCMGKTIDFGCGVGELLGMLPGDSIGFEVNKFVVAFCKSRGLKVEHYDPVKDDYRFDMITQGMYITFTMNHVLEHIENSQEVIHKIFGSCNRLEIKRIVFTVPGYKGYLSDKTHLTFIDEKYFADNGLLGNEYYKIKLCKFFPVNREAFGHYFTHNELRLIFDRRND